MILRLSIELIRIILEDLNLRDVKCLRLVNKELKSLIDKTLYLSENVRIRFEITQKNSNELCSLFNFAENSIIRELRMLCYEEIDWLHTVNPFKLSRHYVKIEFTELNLDSLGILNLFAEVCEILIVKSFTCVIKEPSYQQINEKHFLKLPNLTSLSIQFTITYQSKYFDGEITPDEAQHHENILKIIQTRAEKMKNVELLRYKGSCASIGEFCNNLTLESFSLFAVSNKCSNYPNFKFSSKRVSISINDSNISQKVMLLIDTSKIECMELMHSNYYINNNINILVKFFNNLNQLEFKKLYNISLDLFCLHQVEKSNYQYPDTITEISFNHEIIEFLNTDVKYIANNLPKLHLLLKRIQKLIVNLKNVKDELMITQSIKKHFNLMKQMYPNITKIFFKIDGSKYKNFGPFKRHSFNTPNEKFTHVFFSL